MSKDDGQGQPTELTIRLKCYGGDKTEPMLWEGRWEMGELHRGDFFRSVPHTKMNSDII